MIVVTLGTASFPFDRAVNWLSILLNQGVISEPIFLQHGVTDASALADHPLVTLQRTVELKELLKWVDTARLVISHAGQGSSRMLAARSTPFILLPRLKRYAEHIDDHQLEFAEAIATLGVQHCLSLEDLSQAIINPPSAYQRRLFDQPKLSNHLVNAYSSIF